MYKNVLICWIFGRINLSEEEIRKFCALIPSEGKEDWIKIIENGDLKNYPASVAEIAQQDFIVEATDFISFSRKMFLLKKEN